jgi:hypothetical protein
MFSLNLKVMIMFINSDLNAKLRICKSDLWNKRKSLYHMLIHCDVRVPYRYRTYLYQEAWTEFWGIAPIVLWVPRRLWRGYVDLTVHFKKESIRTLAYHSYQPSNHCCGSGSWSAWIRIILEPGNASRSASASNKNTDPRPYPHQSDKLDPVPDPNPHQFEDKPKCMEYEAILALF